MADARLVIVSKYLSKHLRHQPERLGLRLAPGGWVEVDELLRACAWNGFPISREELDEVVARNDKKRFSFDQTGEMIRANQGHSVEIDLQLSPSLPPEVLYHGTGHRKVEAIMKEGLRKMSRHHVHLSTDIQTAIRVGMRHGKPVVFAVDTVAMQEAGFLFFLSANGVWLVHSVPPDCLPEVE